MKTVMNLLSGGRMVKWKGRVASLAPALASVSVVALMATGAFAQVAIDNTPTVIGNTTATQYIVVPGDITVSGHVNVLQSTNTVLNLVGVDTGADYANTFTNNGVIEGQIAYTSGGEGGAVVGLTVYNGLSGSIVNNGDILLDLTVTDSTDPSATGIWVDGDVSGSIQNNGTISATMMTGSDSASAFGIYIDNLTETGTITNAGLIEAKALGDTSSVSAYGIYVNGDVAGAITNTADGVISALANSSTYTASAWGMYVDGDVTDTGSITNDGTISVLADADSYYYAYAYGIEAGNVAGSISNTGTIDVVAQSGSSTASAYGIYVDDLSGTITNAGTITVLAEQGTESDASAYGIYAGVVDGAILNTGTIKVDASAVDSSAVAYGIYVDSIGVTGSITNAGLIDASALDFSDSATAYGIYVDGVMDGSISNTGTIKADATLVDGSYATAYGIYISGVTNGSISNSGLIEVKVKSAENTDSNEVYGIYLGDDLNGSLTNTATGVISVISQPGSGSAEAYGLYLSGEVALGASVLNEGSITVASTSFDSDITGYGVYVSGDVNGSVTNAASGTITVTSNSASSTPSAYGIYVSGNVNGLVVNAGSIVATAETPENSDAYAYGIYVSGYVTADATVINAGSINATASSDYSVSAYGMYFDNEVQGTVTNTASGVITVSATAGDSSSAEAYGIYAYYVTGNLTNAGLIDVSADTTDSASETDVYAYGIYTYDIYGGGEINNSGTIKVRGTSDGTSTYTAAGVWIDDAIQDGTLTNTGVIDVAFRTTDEENSAYGIYSGAVENGGTIDNQGLITVASSAVDSDASAYGIYVDFDSVTGMDGTILNSGTISASATTTNGGTGTAYGIYVESNMTGVIINTGTIEATATATATGEGTADEAIANGIEVHNLNGGAIVNSGKILATAHSIDSYGSAYGIVVYDGTGSSWVENSGEIIVDSTDAENTNATGVYLSSFEGYFQNTGKIASNDGAIYVDGGEAGAQVGLSTGGFIAGTVEFNDSVNVSVQSATGMSVHWTFDDNNDTIYGGGYSINPLDDTIAVFSTGLNGLTPEVATFDASSIAAGRQQGANSAMAGMGDLVAKTAASTAVPAQVTSGPADAGGFKPFVNASSSHLSYAGNDTAMDQSVTTTALTVGGTKQTDGGLALGLAAGTAMGATSVAGQWATASESKSNSAFAGASLASTMGNLTLSGGVTAGSVNFDNTRFVNDNLATDGIAAMDSSNSDTYLAVQLGMSGRFAMGADMALLPSAMVSYANHSTTGFTEVDGAEVDASSFGVAQGEFGLTVEKTMAQGVLSLGVSQVTRSFSGASAVDVSMLDQTESVDATIPNSSATKVSIGYAAGTVGSAQFNFGAETLLGASGATGSKISGTISFRF